MSFFPEEAFFVLIRREETHFGDLLDAD